MSNLIYLTSLSPTLQQYFNVGKATVKGTELGVEQRFENWLRALGVEQRFENWIKIFGSFTWNDAKVTANDAFPQTVGSRLTYMPEYQYSVAVDCTVGPVSTYLIGRYVSKVYSNSQNLDTVNGVYTSYDPYYLVDASISYKIAKFLTASVSVNNIFDKQYFYYYKAAGRSWFTELTWHF